MNWEDFYKSIKSGSYQNLYLFTGPEEWNKKEALSALRKAILPIGLEQLNEVTLEGCGAQAIIDAAETLPVMCERRIVVVRDWGPLISGKSKDEEKNVERFMEWMKDMPESCILIFYLTVEIDARKKLSKALKSKEGYIEFSYLSSALLLKWCNQQLKPYNKKIRPDALAEMNMMAGQELTRLHGELGKLASYTGEHAEILVEDVRAVVSPSPEYSVFMILDKLLEGNLTEATLAANAALMSVPSPVRLISMFASQLRIDAHMKLTLEDSGNMPETLKALNVSDYRSKYILRQIRSIPAKKLQECYLVCVEADYAIKSGALKERPALDSLMLKIAARFRGNQSARRFV